MTLKQYIKALKELEKKHGEKEVWYAVDNEGNDFCPVHYIPSINEVTPRGQDDCKEVIIIN